MQNGIKSLLAVLAFIGFGCCLVALFAFPIPEGTKDILLVVIGALITMVKDVFGYYFGSSEGSARKTELMSQSDIVLPEATPPGGGQGGYIRVGLALLVGLAMAALLLQFGCASTASVTKDSPQVLAGKSLLSVKSAIVTAAQATDGLCRTGALTPDKCLEARAAYAMAKPAYDSAVDAYLLMIQGSDPAQFATALQRVQGISANLARLTGVIQ